MDTFAADQEGSSSSTGPQRITSDLIPKSIPVENPPSYNNIVMEIKSGTLPTKDDELAFLRHFDTVFIIDDSTSMLSPDGSKKRGPNGYRRQSRWADVREALEVMLRNCVGHDPDGVDIYFILHTEKSRSNIVSVEEGLQIYDDAEPKEKEDDYYDGNQKVEGETPLGAQLEAVLKAYRTRYSRKYHERGIRFGVRPVNIITLTDGRPDDEKKVRDCIKETVKFLEGRGDLKFTHSDKRALPYQVGILFVLVGTEKGAIGFFQDLKKRFTKLSWNPWSHMRNIIEVVHLDDIKKTFGEGRTGMAILKLVGGSIQDHWEKIKEDNQ